MKAGGSRRGPTGRECVDCVPSIALRSMLGYFRPLPAGVKETQAGHRPVFIQHFVRRARSDGFRVLRVEGEARGHRPVFIQHFGSEGQERPILCSPFGEEKRPQFDQHGIITASCGPTCYSGCVEYESLTYPPYDAPLAEAYGGCFESVFVVLHPFVSVPEQLAWRATKQYPRKRWALGREQAAAAAEETNRARREIRGGFTLLF